MIKVPIGVKLFFVYMITLGGSMRIGIDLGGSHINIGVIEEGKVLQKKEHNFSEREKQNLEETLRQWLHEEIENIKKNIGANAIEMVGIAVPRKTERRKYYKCM